MSSKREAKRRALLKLIDRIPLRPAPVKPTPDAQVPPGIAMPPARPAPLATK